MIVSNEQIMQHLSYVKGTVSAFGRKDWGTELYIGQPLFWPRHEMGTFGKCSLPLVHDIQRCPSLLKACH